MSVDYDLIILGTTPAAMEAAIAAATLKARVALITHSNSMRYTHEVTSYHALLHLAHQTDSLHYPQPFFLRTSAPPSLQWHLVNDWIAAITHNLETLHSPAVLASHGIDVITGIGEFRSKPTLTIQVNDRQLQARGYLLALPPQPLIPAIVGLSSVGYLTPATLPDNLAPLSRCQTIAILGSGKTAIELAQVLTRLGIATTILTEQPRLLPTVDRAIAQLIQAQLEAEGVRLLLQTSIDQIRMAGKKELLVNQEILEFDELILAAGQSPNPTALNLDAIGVAWNDRGIRHNLKLQTTHPRVYICQGQIDNEYFTQVAKEEATIALHNILFFPSRQVNYQLIPVVTHTIPELAWVGLSADEAIQIYGKKQVYSLHQPFHTLPSAQFRDDLTGFCTLIVHRNGRLLGAHLAGAGVSEWIGTLALALRQRLNIGTIASLPLPSLTQAEILQHTAAQFRHLYLKRHDRLHDLIDYFFDLRRAWTSP